MSPQSPDRLSSTNGNTGRRSSKRLDSDSRVVRKNDESPENPWIRSNTFEVSPQSPDRHESFENSLNLASGLSSSAPIHGVPTGQSHGAETNNSPLNFQQAQQAQQVTLGNDFADCIGDPRLDSPHCGKTRLNTGTGNNNSHPTNDVKNRKRMATRKSNCNSAINLNNCENWRKHTCDDLEWATPDLKRVEHIQKYCSYGASGP